MTPKYEFTGETKKLPDGPVIKRIRLLRDLPKTPYKKGMIGGWILSEDNLSHNGLCWVADEAVVYDYAAVYDSAIISEKAIVREGAVIRGNAKVYGEAKVYGDVLIEGNAKVYGKAKVGGGVAVLGNVKIYDRANVSGINTLNGDLEILGNTRITDSFMPHSIIMDMAKEQKAKKTVDKFATDTETKKNLKDLWSSL